MKSTLWKMLMVSGLAVMALGLSGCGGATDETDVNVDDSVAVDSSVSAEVMAPVTYTSGKSATTQFAEDSGRDDYEMVLNSVVDGWRYPDGALGGSVSPSAGMKLVVANVSVSEMGEAFANVTMNDFSLTVNGQSYKPTWFLAGHGRSEFPSMLTVNAGETVTHDLVFEVSADTDLTDATLDYADVIAKEESAMSFTVK